MEFIISSTVWKAAIALHIALAIASSFLLLKFPIKRGALAISLLLILIWSVPIVGSTLAMLMIYIHQRKLNMQQ